MNDIELNRRELTGDDALRFARESGMERASETRGLFLCGVGDLIRFARIVRAGWNPVAASPSSKSTKEDPRAANDPADPGYDVAVLREHVRHLERRIRDLHRDRVLASSSIKEDGERAARLLTEQETQDAFADVPWPGESNPPHWMERMLAVQRKLLQVNGLPSPPSPLGDTSAAVRKCLYCERDMLAGSECLSKAQSESCGMRAPLGDTPAPMKPPKDMVCIQSVTTNCTFPWCNCAKRAGDTPDQQEQKHG